LTLSLHLKKIALTRITHTCQLPGDNAATHLNNGFPQVKEEDKVFRIEDILR